MVKNKKQLYKFEVQFKKEQQINYQKALKLLESMYEHYLNLKITTSLPDIENNTQKNIFLARVINCLKN
jgi:hypothetical protein